MIPTSANIRPITINQAAPRLILTCGHRGDLLLQQANKIDASNIRAEMRDGLLTLTIPKSEDAKAQQIEIS